jgi:hypothetical protein
MYKKPKYHTTELESIERPEGETIEQKIERIVNSGEPITDGAPLIYTERKDGIKPEYDIRTDRWEIATEAMDKVQANMTAKREERQAQTQFKIIEGGETGKPESTQGTKAENS